jgi:hypothetical protein
LRSHTGTSERVDIGEELLKRIDRKKSLAASILLEVDDDL